MKQHHNSNSTQANVDHGRDRRKLAVCGDTMLREELCEAEVDYTLLSGDISFVLKGIN